MPAFNSRINKALESRRAEGLERKVRTIFSGNQAELECDGKRYINFSSNDYLGLAADPELVRAWQQGLSIYGSGSGASPLVTGFSPAHHNLCSALTEWLGFERAVLFGSGFSANQAMLYALLEKGDVLIQDKLNHASLMEAGLMCPATMKRFKHNDVEHLSRLLVGDNPSLTVTEGVFSMDGDCAPLIQIADQVKKANGWLAVDDAHGIGVRGKQGAGSCNEAGIKPQILIVTFGKAFGLSGAAILCDQNTGDYLDQFARHHVYSTAIPPSQAYALTHAIKMIQTQEWRRKKLSELTGIYDDLMSDVTGYVATHTPIKPFMIGDAEKTIAVAERCKSEGVWLTGIRPPTVPKGTARLRVTLTANHKKSQIEILAMTLKQSLGEA